MRKSQGFTKPEGAMKVKAVPAVGLGRIPSRVKSARAHYRPVSAATSARRSESVHVGTRKMVNYA